MSVFSSGVPCALASDSSPDPHTGISDGVVTIPGLPLANYLADVYRSIEEIPQGVPALVQARKVAGEQDNVLVVPREKLESGGVRGRLLFAPGVRLTNPQVYLLPPGENTYRATGVDPETGIFSQWWPVQVGEGRLTGPLQVFPGRFEWSVSKQGQLVDSRELVVEPGSRLPLITGADDAAPRK